MTDIELKRIVAAYLAEGIPLPEIQDRLETEHQHKIKFFDLRMLAAELDDVDWEKFSPEAPVVASEEAVPATHGPGDGQTHVNLSKIARPGMMASGSVVFATGATADWYVDNAGRFGIENVVGEPTPEDQQAFVGELRKMLGGY